MLLYQKNVLILNNYFNFFLREVEVKAILDHKLVSLQHLKRASFGLKIYKGNLL